jgi:hypothetical protein
MNRRATDTMSAARDQLGVVEIPRAVTLPSL